MLAVEVYQLLIELSGWTPQQYEMSVAVVIDWLLDQAPQRRRKREGHGGDQTGRHRARTCRTEVIVQAPAEAAWRVVADVTRTGEWSHECHQVAWRQGATQAAPGVRFRGRNRSGWLR